MIFSYPYSPYVLDDKFLHYSPYSPWTCTTLYPPTPWGGQTVHVPTVPLQWPSLHPLLSANSTATTYDVRKQPREAIPIDVYLYSGTQPVQVCSAHPPKRILVISKAFPWVIDVNAKGRGSGLPLTCKEVWKTLYVQLHIPVTGSEWLHIARDESVKRAVLGAYEKRVPRKSRPSSPLLRIDYLGENTLFVGLEKNDNYADGMLMPETKKGVETWVANFTEAP